MVEPWLRRRTTPSAGRCAGLGTANPSRGTCTQRGQSPVESSSLPGKGNGVCDGPSSASSTGQARSEGRWGPRGGWDERGHSLAVRRRRTQATCQRHVQGQVRSESARLSGQLAGKPSFPRPPGGPRTHRCRKGSPEREEVFPALQTFPVSLLKQT